tara:strand:- start:89 stop:634 length:546 start_codon:yes stop_codon:yes gene_type:complete
MKIVMKKLSDIKPYWRNARKNDKTVEQAKQSILDFGFNQPISLDSKNVIIAGHARYKAVTQLGWKKVPCIIQEHLTPQQAKEYRIADNKVGELTLWDPEEQQKELKEIGNNMSMQMYFPNVKLDNWLNETVGFNLESITQEEYNEKEHQMDNRFKEQEHKEKTNVTCPHCFEEFDLDTKDL